MRIHLAKLSRLNTSRISHRVGSETRAFQAAPQVPPTHILHVMLWQQDQATFQGGPECRTDTTVKAGTILYIEFHICIDEKYHRYIGQSYRKCDKHIIVYYFGAKHCNNVRFVPNYS